MDVGHSRTATASHLALHVVVPDVQVVLGRVELPPVGNPLEGVAVGLRVALVVYETTELLNRLVSAVAATDLFFWGGGRRGKEEVRKRTGLDRIG